MQSLITIFKYVAVGLSIYLILKNLPNINLLPRDIIILTALVIVVFVLFDQIIGKNLSPSEKKDMCKRVCKLEGMEDVAQVPPPVTTEVTNTTPEVAEETTPQVEPEVTPEATAPTTVEETVKEEVAVEEEQKAPTTQESVVESETGEQVKEDIKTYDGRDVVMKTESKPIKGVDRCGSRGCDGVIVDEIPYTDYNHLPLADTYEPGNFEYGYSFLPPEKWYPTPPFPPLCVADKRCPVQPVYTTGTPIDVKEWNESRRITGPDNIKTSYIKEKLNSGR